MARPAGQGGAPAQPAVALPGPGPGGRRWWATARLRVGAALAAGLTAGWATGWSAGWSAGHGAAPAPGPAGTGTPAPMPSVVVVPPPSPPPWPSDGSGCEVRTHWVYRFTQSYQGQVYALLSTPTGRSTSTATTLTWGAWAWHHDVTLTPGIPAHGLGGTLLLFDKLDTDTRNPLVEIDTTVPTCAAFGTAGTTSVAPLVTVDAAPGWVAVTPSPVPLDDP
ncbi:hypothetical protein [Kitasatospora sp. NPDC094011]|uniref:hypothetical protein n=1 Tax=Kitasatospora sp. NPDC094011 TaxID=3364090 RepID=UPI0038022C36